MATHQVGTDLGSVEIALSEGAGDVVLIFPGGHATASTPLGADLYTDLGYRVLAFSRPGYGNTDVGDLTAAEFCPAVTQVCDQLEIRIAATVGISFGGLQAAHLAIEVPRLAPRLLLHSCAPSSRPYPDKRVERAAAPIVFGPQLGRLTWRVVRALTRSDRGLRMMMSTLSTQPISAWWPDWTSDDRRSARDTFFNMGSGSGFVLDLHQAGASRTAYRRAVLRAVTCPTLVTASHHDGGVAFVHGEDLAATIPHARLLETNAMSHFYWLGRSRDTLAHAIADFMAGSAIT